MSVRVSVLSPHKDVPNQILMKKVKKLSVQVADLDMILMKLEVFVMIHSVLINLMKFVQGVDKLISQIRKENVSLKIPIVKFKNKVYA